MKTTEQVIEFLTSRIEHIYARPLMYGGTAEGVDNILYLYHELWADIVERKEDYDNVRQQIYKEQECGSAGFARRYQSNHSSSSESDTVKYVVQQWIKISERLGMRISDRITDDLKRRS